jgi:hypothetical protein
VKNAANSKKMLLTAALPLVLGGCLVEVKTVADPGPALARARAEVAELASRPGPAESLQLVAYDPDDRKLVRVGLPLWLVHKAGDLDDRELGDEVGEEMGRDLGRCLKRVRLRDLEKVGRGALVEVEDEDGTQVLVWLR